MQLLQSSVALAQRSRRNVEGGCVLTDLLVSHHRPQVGIFIWGREAKERCWCLAWKRGLGAGAKAEVMLDLSSTYPQR